MLGYKVMISDREKTAIDCIDRPALAGGVGEAATILATASRRFDWTQGGRLSRTDRVQAPSRGASAGSPITSRPIFRPRCATACSGWPREAARHGSARSRARARGAGRHRL